MLRDNPNVTKANVEQYINRHPHFSNNFNYPRYGPGGLQIAGTVGSQKDRVEEYTGPHPEVMRGHPIVMKTGSQSLEEYKKRINKYMVECWQYHNHLHHFRHTERIKYTAEFLKGRSVEIGCLLPGTKITMANQTKKEIQEIVPDDFIISCEGNIQGVLNIFVRDYSDDVYTIDCGFGISLTTTPEHPIYSVIRKKIMCSRQGGTQCNTNGFNGVCSKCGKIKFTNPEYVEINKLSVGDYVAIPILKEGNVELDINEVILIEDNLVNYRNNTTIRKNQKYIFVPIKNITQKHYSGKVYNLEVEEDNSYIAENIGVHNCAMGISTDIMVQHLKSLGKTDVVIEGIEPTDFGFSSAVKTYPHIKFTKAMGENLPFKDGEFDTVLMAEVLEHVLSPEVFLKEAVRICKPGGRIIGTVPCGHHPDPDHQRDFNTVSITRLLEPYCAFTPRIYGLTSTGERCYDHRALYFLIVVGEKHVN